MITVWPSLYRPHEGQAASDRAIVERAKAPRYYARKDDVPRWAGAEFRASYRSTASFVRAWWIVLDFDRGASFEQLAGAFGDSYGIAHSTWTAGRWRVALTLSRPVATVEEFDRVWRAGAAMAEQHDLTPDYAARSSAQCYALPARHDGDAYEYNELGGALFDVDEALALIPPPAPLPASPPAARDDSYSHRCERARRYLERMPGAISGSGGHATTFRAAVLLVRGFGLEPDDALRLLLEVHNPLCAPPWSERQLRHKVKQAHQRGRLPFGFLTDRLRDWRVA
jgi:hypothetical protein